MHILYEIDTNPVTYPIDACQRWRSIPMLSHFHMDKYKCHIWPCAHIPCTLHRTHQTKEHKNIKSFIYIMIKCLRKGIECEWDEGGWGKSEILFFFLFFWLVLIIATGTSCQPCQFYCNIPVFLFNIIRLNILYILKVAWGVCMYVWMGCLCSSARDVTKHGDWSLSLTGINWVSDGVSINSKEIYAYQKGLLLA